MTTIPADTWSAYERAKKAHTDAVLDVHNSWERFNLDPGRATLLTVRADTETLLAKSQVALAADREISAYTTPQLDDAQVRLLNTAPNRWETELRDAEEMLDKLDQMLTLIDS